MHCAHTVLISEFIGGETPPNSQISLQNAEINDKYTLNTNISPSKFTLIYS